MNKVKKKDLRSRLLGLICGAGAGFFYAFGNGLVQFIYRHNAHAQLSEFQVVFVRSLIQLILASVLLSWKRIKPWGGTWSSFGMLWMMGLVKIGSIIFFYGSLAGLPLGDATVILFTAPVFTIILGIVLLKEPCSLCNIIFGLVSFLGVAIIAAPGLFFPGSVHTSGKLDPYHGSHSILPKTNLTTNLLVVQQVDQQQAKSVGFGIVAAVGLSLHMIILKMNTKTVDYRVAILYPSFFGIALSPICMLVEQKNIVTGELGYQYWLLMAATGFSYFIGMTILAYALSLEDAGLVALVRNSEVIFAFIFEIVLEKQMPLMFSIVGVVLIVWSTSMIVLNRVFNIEGKIGKHLCCCFAMCQNKDHELAEEYELVSSEAESEN